MIKEFLMHKLKIISVAMGFVLLLIIGLIYLQPTPSIIENIPIVEYAEDPVPDFTQYTQVTQKKQAFFDYLTPAVQAQNQYIKDVRQYVQGLRAKHIAGEELSKDQQEELDWLIHEYRVDKTQSIDDKYKELFRKIDIIPIELVLIQTANESGWGTSRFATKGYNFFGLWCFREGCGFVPSRRSDGAAHEVAKFDDLSSAMYAYMRNLNSHPAYKDLRKIRQKQRNNQKPITAHSMAAGLTKYSERGEEYVDELRDMMRINAELINP
ncbi:MAG: Bax protein [Kangiellaceae bacterium]|jgi:Bax protein